jgi:hypothetical protein
MPAFDAVEPALRPLVERKRDMLEECLTVSRVEKPLDLVVRLDGVVLSREQNDVIEAQIHAEQRVDSFERRPDVTEPTVVARVSLEEMNIRKRHKRLGHAVKDDVVGLPIDMNEEVATGRAQPRDKADELFGQLVGGNEIGELHGRC